MKLEVGMYVRDIKGRIDKIIGFKGALIEFEKDLMGGYIDCNDFTKATYNIVNILEVGDYVNGLIVEKNKYGELYTSYVYYGGDIGKQCEVYTNWLKGFKEDMIYNIVTKEQFEQMSYKVGE